MMKEVLKHGWSLKKLDQLGFVGRGRSRHRPRNAPELYGGDYPFIQTADVTASEFHITSYSKTYSDLGLNQSKMWNKGTLCIVNAGENTGETAILAFEACFPDSIIGFIADPTEADVYFIKYYLDILKPILRSVTKGATQDNLSVDKLLSFDILTPPLAVQQKIADILSTYDRLIENNTRRIKILEEMSQLLYREWFVNFRFPGYEEASMVESELGLIPQGWEATTLSNICTIVMGQSPKSEFYNETGEGLPFHQGVTNFRDRFPVDKTYCTVFNRIAEAGDILFSVRAPVGRINLTDKKIAIGRGLCAIRSKQGFQSFIFQQLKEKFQEEDTIGGGTIFKAVTKDDMYGIKMLQPLTPLVQRFEQIIQPTFLEVEILTRKNHNLRATRDLLLPKLISGEIDVEAIESSDLEAIAA